jgi:hypothetical protein
MRLQNFNKISAARLLEFAKKFETPGILKAALLIKQYAAKRKKKEKRL